MTEGFTRRVVLDTNIIVSALLQPLGPPAQIFLLAMSGSLQLCMSGGIYTEYEEVIKDNCLISSTAKSPKTNRPR